MKRRAAIALAYALTLGTVPWLAAGDGYLLGMPAWAAYSLLTTALACGFVAHALSRHWDDAER